MLVKKNIVYTADNSCLLRYIADIECGNTIVGQELWLMLKKLREDMASGEYVFDRSDALLRMDFMENCVKLTKSPFFGKPMILMSWQKAYIEALYSFKMPDTLYDRFTRSMLLIARKNTKSETSSGLGLSELITGNDGEDIVCSSNDDNQASIVYDAIDMMRKLIDPNDLDSKRNQRFILNKVNNSKIFKLSDRTRNKEGRNIDFAIIDEVHEMKENVIVKSIEQSQSLKENPKLIMITTEGFVVDGFLDKELERARKIIFGEDDSISGKRYLPWLYTQDSESEIWQNRSSWVKSNPTLGIVKKWSYLDEQVDIAKRSKADRIFVLSKDFNVKQNASESWLNVEDYSYSGTFDIEKMSGAIVLGAVDMSETTDLTCAKIMIERPDSGKKYVYSMYFIPESKLTENDDRNAGAKYREWAEQGYITITEGADLDLAVVADWFYSLYDKYDIRLWKCGYDQKFAKAFINQMGAYNWTKENEDLVMILQNADTLSNAIKLAEADLKARRCIYNENPVDRWCFKNAGIKVNDRGQCLIVKQQPHMRIDGAVTHAILYEMYRRYRREFKEANKIQ